MSSELNKMFSCGSLWGFIACHFFLILSGCSAFPDGIMDVPKPKCDFVATSRPRAQPVPPTGLKENPFVDSTPAPILTDSEKKRGYMLFSRPITAPVYKGTHPNSWERFARLAGFATPGEYEPLTFSVYPARDIKDFRVVVSPLRSDNGVIDGVNLDLRAVTYWRIRYPRYTSKKSYRSQPELLEKVDALDLTRGVCQRYWLKVHVPNDAKPGVYRGFITLFSKKSLKAVRFPISMRVLNFKLKRDPKKRYSVYYAFPPYQTIKRNSEKWDRARETEMKAMLSYGIDMFPTVGLSTRMLKNGEVEVYVREARNVDKMVRMGFKGPIPVTGGMWHFYQKYAKGGKIHSHWRITKIPSDGIYKEIERAFRKLRERTAKRGWPELVCCPMDEVSPSTAKFAAKVFAAIRRSGMKTYATKDPTSVDAAFYRKLDAVYAWCSQPFAMPYEKVIADNTYEYWTYPNHNAGEIKDRVVMMKGGRMTYGVGLWRSGYTTVIPWHWRWITDKKAHFNYLSGRGLSGCGFRVDEKNLEIIPAVYWECFREGYDDLRYIYTLEDALAKRAGSNDAKCQNAVKKGKTLLREIWNSIKPQKKYLKEDLWTDGAFQARRWQVASMIMELSRFPETRIMTTPSVLKGVAESEPESSNDDFLSKSVARGWVDRLRLSVKNYSNWKAVNKEASKKVVLGAHPVLKFNVKVDYKIDGGGENGKYPIGWPRISQWFRKGEVDLTQYEYLRFMIKVDSNRSEVADDVTPFIINFAAHDSGAKKDVVVDLGDKPRVWIPVTISISKMISDSGFEKKDWRDLRMIQLVIAESHYADGTEMRFDIKDIALLKFNRPVLRSIDCADVLLNSNRRVPVYAKGYGLNAPGNKYALSLRIVSSNGETVLARKTPLSQNAVLTFDANGIAVGQYNLELSVVDVAGKTLSKISKKVAVIKGFQP